jgi:hypothetical protein
VKKMLVSLTILASVFVSGTTTQAIYGGDSAIGDTRVASVIKDSITSRTSFCTVSLLTPQIVVSAAHCSDARTTHFGLPYDSSSFTPYADFWVAQPGVDISKDDTSTRVKIVKGYITKGWSNTFPCTATSACTQVDDIVFWVLEKPLVSSYAMTVANAQEVAALKSSGSEVTHIGYGYYKLLTDANPVDGTPRKLIGNATSLDNNQQGKITGRTIITKTSTTQSVCPGDSGSPVYSTFSGKEKIFAVQYAGYGGGGLCDTNPWPAGKTPMVQNTLIYPYIDLIRSEPLAAAVVAAFDSSDVATATTVPAVIATQKSATISCVKGKIVKKVTAINPKCPTGYKKR